jgi:hypothetical protein
LTPILPPAGSLVVVEGTSLPARFVVAGRGGLGDS